MAPSSDLQALQAGASAAGHGLIQFFLVHNGAVYVMSDNHYIPLQLDQGIIFYPEAIVNMGGDRRAAISGLSRESGYEGIVPVTNGALNDVQDAGLEVIAKGMILTNVPRATDRVGVDVYK
jgi:hypothetical protein|tara:strand:+ start:36 stop:398 length:363 start_codon:yes stop_codon:yes gene_type:complete